MDPVTVAAGIGSAVGGIFGGVINANAQTGIARDNLKLQKDQFEYQKRLNDLTMQREDTAVQRSVADYRAAGLSPLNAIGNPSAVGSYQSSDAPQQQAVDYSASLSNSLTALGSIVQLMNQTRVADSEVKKNNAEAEKTRDDIGLGWEELGFKRSAERERAKEFTKTLEETKRVNDSNISVNSKKVAQIESILSDSEYYNKNYREDDYKLKQDALRLANLMAVKDYSERDLRLYLDTLKSFGSSEVLSALYAGASAANTIDKKQSPEIVFLRRIFDSILNRSQADGLKADYGDLNSSNKSSGKSFKGHGVTESW